MKCHTKISPHPPALPVQKPDSPSLKIHPNAKDLAPVTRSEFPDSFRVEQTASSAVAAEKEEACLIYVVDDEPRLLDLYTIILEARGYIVRAFDNRIEALAELKGDRKKPDLLIMDYLGHAMAVEGFMQRCVLAHPGLRILVASGYSQTDARFGYVRPDRFIQQPFTAEEFLQEVGAALAV